jgi:hypothetical protein
MIVAGGYFIQLMEERILAGRAQRRAWGRRADIKA